MYCTVVFNTYVCIPFILKGEQTKGQRKGYPIVIMGKTHLKRSISGLVMVTCLSMY